MVKFVSTIFALAAAAIAVRRVLQAKQGTQPVNVTENEDLQAAADKSKAKTKQSLENAKENAEGAAELAKGKVRGTFNR